MQAIELALIVVGALAVLAAGALRSRSRFGRHPLAFGAALGIVPGILGAIVVLVPRTDLIPDAAEPYAWLAVGFVVSGMAIVALTIGVVRR